MLFTDKTMIRRENVIKNTVIAIDDFGELLKRGLASCTVAVP